MSCREACKPLSCREFRRFQRMSRRHALQAGAISALGLGLGDLELRMAHAQEHGMSLPAKRAKACIFLFMWGGPSQLETFDMKPDAPAEVRGEFNPVSTKVPGLQICEHFG